LKKEGSYEPTANIKSDDSGVRGSESRKLKGEKKGYLKRFFLFLGLNK